MKYHIDTIPVWDAYRQGGECPVCILEHNAEKAYVESFLGGSVMEPDIRIEVNKKGFCPCHFAMLYDAQNRLGLALMVQTYLKETSEEFEHLSHLLKKDSEQPPRPSSPSILSMFSARKDLDTSIAAFNSQIAKHRDKCIICDRIDYTLNRYSYTILHLWNTDPEFKAMLLSSKGFCLPHLATVMRISRETISRNKQAQWIADILPLQSAAIKSLEEDLLWFTQKFDYRNQDKPWGSSKDALSRALQKLTGKFIL